MNIEDLKAHIVDNFEEFCTIMKDKFKVVGLSADMIDISDNDLVFIDIEDDAECVECIYISLDSEDFEIECNLKDVLFYVQYFYDAMD